MLRVQWMDGGCWLLKLLGELEVRLGWSEKAWREGNLAAAVRGARVKTSDHQNCVRSSLRFLENHEKFELDQLMLFHRFWQAPLCFLNCFGAPLDHQMSYDRDLQSWSFKLASLVITSNLWAGFIEVYLRHKHQTLAGTVAKH